ncbi:MAG TPA: hypothetical protein VI451_01150 [Anaerolineales bacterium]|nr:hypothetical protein [Anaerolineales bacterium]
MTVKILMTWDILPGREQEYFEFVVREWIPRIQKLGLQPNDAWYTYYGNSPQIMATALMNTLPDMENVLNSQEWNELTQELMDYVEDFNYKIVKARSGFQL